MRIRDIKEQQRDPRYHSSKVIFSNAQNSNGGNNNTNNSNVYEVLKCSILTQSKLTAWNGFQNSRTVTGCTTETMGSEPDAPKVHLVQLASWVDFWSLQSSWGLVLKQSLIYSRCSIVFVEQTRFNKDATTCVESGNEDSENTETTKSAFKSGTVL